MSRSASFLFLVAVITAAFSSACGNNIGDSCSTNSDCGQENMRTCDTNQPGGYCTSEACDFDTCPAEAVCVRFYPGVMTDETCDQAAPGDCEISEVCTVLGLCASRATERRFCMLKCATDGDCRDGYECRTRGVMMLHGGEPVPNATDPTMSTPEQGFCAARRTCTVDADCLDAAYHCNAKRCVTQ